MRTLAALLALALLAGCESLSYYGQAIGGHFKLLSAARPIDSWLADPATSSELKERLESARRIREYATRELHLPDNASYTAYADLGRRFAVYNVFAAPKFSVEPKAECFPITGCVAYRGFFSEKDALRHAEKLRADEAEQKPASADADPVGLLDTKEDEDTIHAAMAELTSKFHRPRTGSESYFAERKVIR